jgi:hypothetical protein
MIVSFSLSKTPPQYSCGLSAKNAWKAASMLRKASCAVQCRAPDYPVKTAVRRIASAPQPALT